MPIRDGQAKVVIKETGLSKLIRIVLSLFLLTYRFSKLPT